MALASTVTNTARFAALEQEVLAARLTPVKRGTPSSTPKKQRQQKPKIVSPRFRPPMASPGKRSRAFESPEAREWPSWMKKVDEPSHAGAESTAEPAAASPEAPTATLPPPAYSDPPRTDPPRVNAVAPAGLQRSKTLPRLRSQGSSRLPMGLPPRILSLATGRPSGVTPHRSLRSADEVASQIASGHMHLQHVLLAGHLLGTAGRDVPALPHARTHARTHAWPVLSPTRPRRMLRPRRSKSSGPRRAGGARAGQLLRSRSLIANAVASGAPAPLPQTSGGGRIRATPGGLCLLLPPLTRPIRTAQSLSVCVCASSRRAAGEPERREGRGAGQ